jgi:alkylation response protein AidB-like acyl-CoA dehydrogenase
VLRRVENARSLAHYAGWAWTRRHEEFALAANALLVAAGDALDLAARECIFVHGGLGATWEHDASLYYRRAELSRRLAGGADAAADAVAEELLSGVC